MQVLRKYVDTMKERCGSEAEAPAVWKRLHLLEQYLSKS